MQQLDLSSLQSVRDFAAAWRAAGRPLHVLVNNAGIFAMGAVSWCQFELRAHVGLRLLIVSAAGILPFAWRARGRVL